MTKLQGEVYLSLTNSQIKLELLDFENRELLTRQLEEKSDKFVNLYNYDTKHPQKTSKLKQFLQKLKLIKTEQTVEPEQKFSLSQTQKDGNADDLVKYIKSVLDKLFPKYPNDQLSFGMTRSYHRPYEYAVGYRPMSKNDETFEFNVEYQGRSERNQHMNVKISWDFKYDDDAYYMDMLNSETFAHEILYALSESPFLQYAFTFNNKDSYSSYIQYSYFEYNEKIKLQLLGYHFAADTKKLHEEMNSLVKLIEDYGQLIPLDETDSLLNYDGHGYLCKEIDGEIYNSYIEPDMDYELPDIYKNHFTHIYWYNR